MNSWAHKCCLRPTHQVTANLPDVQKGDTTTLIVNLQLCDAVLSKWHDAMLNGNSVPEMAFEVVKTYMATNFEETFILVRNSVHSAEEDTLHVYQARTGSDQGHHVASGADMVTTAAISFVHNMFAKKKIPSSEQIKRVTYCVQHEVLQLLYAAFTEACHTVQIKKEGGNAREKIQVTTAQHAIMHMY